MPYLPSVRPSDPTAFPEQSGKDLDMDVRLIQELWETVYPLVPYVMIDRRTTPVADVNTLTGEAGASKFDPLWGESQDANRTTWRQPHGTDGAVKAADVEVFKTPVSLHMQVNPVTETRPDLHKYGFDEDDRRIGRLLVTIPCSLLDNGNVVCTAGDLVKWEGDEFLVLKTRLTGYWKNTNVRLYMSLLCDHRRHGS